MEKYWFVLFSEKCWRRLFCRDSRLIIWKKCMATPIFHSNRFCKDLLFPHRPNLAQKPPYLVGKVNKYTIVKSFWNQTEQKHPHYRQSFTTLLQWKKHLSSSFYKNKPTKPQLIAGNGYETHCSIFLFTFFNRDSAKNKNIPAYIGQWANENVWVWSVKHNEWA